MSRQSRRGASSPFAWTTILYLLFVLVAPFALLGTANAGDAQAPIENENLKNGMEFGAQLYKELQILIGL